MACIYTIVAKPMRALELQYPMILFLINFDISGYIRKKSRLHPRILGSHFLQTLQVWSW